MEKGQKFDAWDEFFSYENWMGYFADTGIDPAFYANRVMGETELLPWDFIDIGVTKRFLLSEKHKAEAETTTPDCRTKCSACGANTLCGGKGCSAHPVKEN